jgi:DNA-binding NarL/FixJ family response regulator
MSSGDASSIRILLVDDHQIIRDGLRDLITSQPNMAVVGDAGDPVTALELARLTRPDIIVLDLDLGQESGLTLLPEFISAVPAVGVIVLTGMRDVEKRDRAMELGAKGVVLKENGAVQLLQAIEKVHLTGDYWFEPGAARRLLDKSRSADKREVDPETIRIAALTERERQIIALVGEGLENKEIAQRLRPVVAEPTVRNNLSIIYDKLNIKGGRLGLLVYAYKHGLVPPSR